ncbi:MAG TPA: cell division protein ZapA [Candidatus Hydrogenedentes bacterium]|nr:cell division protein ZapA [Candidatus Hydrogenedentota bacterium]HOT51515.1 cell division protein ZapA [Candidatus Hydrogenedentota bacterium]HOV75835.1 cell division protein ZapA [Candidatus Hydrogenedentota bacterium]HPC15641.1 cell division protein ZapA [Candidatus Hydrogenedentota bacterium]HRT19461.1 cell division protein ZapA [Candidatus Hydrogenedentota bacterium]
MKPETVEVVVGRMRLNVPVFTDEETTLRIAEQVNARLEEIEKKSPRVDSLLTALSAAMSFACELENERIQAEKAIKQAEEDYEAQQREFFHALNRIAHALREESGDET